MTRPEAPEIQKRLQQTSLYRPDLDLVVLDDAGSVAGYALFWPDPTTGVGLVEPMRTHEAHRRRGLARHLLTVGIERLAAIGADRVKLCFRPANEAAKRLYLSAGFVPDKETLVGSHKVRNGADP